MRVAITGCGGIAAAHAQCVEMAGDEIIAVADVNEDAARQFAGKHGGVAFKDVEDLLAQARPDAAIVCTPPNSHSAIVTALLEAGVPVLCEKPLAHTVADASDLVDAARRTGVPAYVAYCHRFNPAARLMRDYAREGKLGTLFTFRNAFVGSAPQLTTAWRTDPEISGGGCLMDNGSHSLDILQFIVGPVSEVWSKLHFAAEGRGDVAADLLTVGEGGVAGLISVSYVSARPQAVFEVIGSEMALQYDYESSGSTVTAFRPGAEPALIEMQAGCDVRFIEQYRAFSEAMKGRPTALATFDEALSVSRVIDRCQQQAGTPGGVC